MVGILAAKRIAIVDARTESGLDSDRPEGLHAADETTSRILSAMTSPKLPPEDAPFSRGDAVVSAIGATLLIVTEMLGAVFAFAFAIEGLIGLGDTATWVVTGILAVPCLWAAVGLTRRILRVEAKLRSIAAAG